MPTSFTGLLLFVVLLLPGFTYQVGKERSGGTSVPRRSPSTRLGGYTPRGRRSV
ncbi:DUF6338 family protein [Actinomadura geliboluensis]|uniref:DUF6338 family protein n=1 Tax=Actinomadura geliboluensis TaxID=882440 RepID=UPI0037223876